MTELTVPGPTTSASTSISWEYKQAYNQRSPFEEGERLPIKVNISLMEEVGEKFRTDKEDSKRIQVKRHQMLQHDYSFFKCWLFILSLYV